MVLLVFLIIYLINNICTWLCVYHLYTLVYFWSFHITFSHNLIIKFNNINLYCYLTAKVKCRFIVQWMNLFGRTCDIKHLNIESGVSSSYNVIWKWFITFIYRARGAFCCSLPVTWLIYELVWTAIIIELNQSINAQPKSWLAKSLPRIPYIEMIACKITSDLFDFLHTLKGRWFETKDVHSSGLLMNLTTVNSISWLASTTY